MKNSFWAALVLGLALAASGSSAQEAASPRVITVSGDGVVEAVPDMAVIRLGVTHEDADAAEAMSKTSDAVSAILARLEALEIEPRDLQTTQLTLNPVWSDHRSTGQERRRITGFVASNQLTVRVRDLAKLGEVVGLVVADGANQFNGLQFTVQDPDPLMEEARKAAVADGIAKAQALADAAGVTLGPVRSISEHGGQPRPMMIERMAMADAAPIAAGEVGLSAQVSMVFEILDE